MRRNISALVYNGLMARTSGYDPEPLDRFRYNQQVQDETMDRIISDGLNPLMQVVVDEGKRIEKEHGVPYDVITLWLSAKVQDAWHDQMVFRAALAHRSGTPKVGIAEIMRWRGGASTVTRRWPELDELLKVYDEARAKATETGEIQNIRLDSSSILTVAPDTRGDYDNPPSDED